MKIFVDRDKEVIVFCNYKCASSSLKACYSDCQENKNIKIFSRPEKFLAWVKLKRIKIRRYKKLLFCRNPYERFMSYFMHWLDGYDETRVVNGETIDIGAYSELKAVLDEKSYDEFYHTLKVEKDIHKAVNLRIAILSRHASSDHHLIPQNQIFKSIGWGAKKFDAIFKLENIDNDSFYSLTGRRLDHACKSTNKKLLYKEYFDDQSFQLMNQVYGDDFKDLGYEMKTRSEIVERV